MTIDEALEYLNDFSLYSHYQEAINTINKASAYIEQMQADYNARLKADLKAILVELQLEFEEDLECGAYCDNCQKSCEDIPARWFLDFIQQKINSLKED